MSGAATAGLLQFCNAVSAGIPLHLACCLQLVINAVAWLVFALSKCDHIMLFLHWLKVPWWIHYKLAVLVFHGLAPSYLADELHHPAEFEYPRRLRSTSSQELSVPRTQVSAYGDRASPVAAVRIWNSLLQHITYAPLVPVFCCRLKTHFFELCYR